MNLTLLILTAVAGAIVLSVQMALAQSTFTKMTTGDIVNDAGSSNSGIWLDYDNDGDLDLYVVNGELSPNWGREPNFLYRNDGNGTFTRITSGPLVEDIEKSTCGAAGDYNNDGYIDLFVGNLGLMDNSRYRNNGDGTFTKIAVPDPAGNTLAGGWVDYDNDGHLDLAVINNHTPRYIWHNNGDETFSRVTQGPLATDVTDAAGASWGDYDNDGDQDLFVANSYFPPNGARRNSFYRNEGNGTFMRITTGALVAQSAVHGVGVWGDYDNDGDLDLFVTNIQGPNFLFQNNGDGTFSRITSGEMVTESGESGGAAWGDYDNDGFLDLFVARGQTTGENNCVYHNNGDGTFTRISEGAIVNDGGHSVGCDWGDYDNDGFLDLFVANTLQENNFLYRNDGNGDGWLKVKLVGTVSNRAAIGAKVRVQASLGGTARWQLREISTGSGISGHNLLAHFGLRDAQKADLVRIEWPSGIVQELRDVPANQTLTVTEPARLQTAGSTQFRIQSWKGMIFEVQSSTDLRNWQPIATVTNLTGTLALANPEALTAPRKFYRVSGRRPREVVLFHFGLRVGRGSQSLLPTSRTTPKASATVGPTLQD